MAETSAAAAGPGTDQSLTWVPLANRLVGARQGIADAVRPHDDCRQNVYGTGVFVVSHAFSQLCDEMRALPVKSGVLEIVDATTLFDSRDGEQLRNVFNQANIQDE